MRKPNNPAGIDYTNKDIAVMAVYRLGGSLRYVHMEDVAMKAAQLAPKKFRWKKYPEQINLEAVRVTLKNELGATSGRVAGGIRHGWMLTPKGFQWCTATDRGEEHQVAIGRVRNEIERAKNTAAYAKAYAGRQSGVTVAELEALLRVDHYSTARYRRERALALANAAELDEELRAALSSLRERGFDQLEVKG